MTESSMPWNGTVLGDAIGASPYDAPTEWAALLRSISGAQGIATDLSGVFTDDLNELAVSGATSPVSVASGRALTYGTRYESTAVETVVIPTPGASTRIDRIVLRKDWAAQTVRITRIAGVEGGAAPALVQIAGTTWDQPLAQASITTGGAITLTDERDMIGIPSVDIQVITATGNWTKPSGTPKLVKVILFGGGGGSGGGEGASAGSDRAGGAGGGGGAMSEADYIPSDLGATEAVAIGAGGAAGTGGSAGVGTNGGVGGTTTFGTVVRQRAFGGGGGVGNQAAINGGGGGGGAGSAGATGSAGTGGTGGGPLGAINELAASGSSGAGGGGSSTTIGGASDRGGAGGGTGYYVTGPLGGSSIRGGPGGGGGMGVTAANAEVAGMAGGTVAISTPGGGGAGGAVNGGAGTAGTSRTGTGRAGDGGGGGGGQDSGTGGIGGAGGAPAGGAGGGAGGTTVGGAGALGGRGEAIVITFF